MKNKNSFTLSLKGLTIAAAQSWHNIRLVPLIRKSIRENLRLGLRSYEDNYCPADWSYIPHGLIVKWDKNPQAAIDTSLKSSTGKRWHKNSCISIPRGLTKREGELQLAPFYYSMESFLAKHFTGPNINWDEYSRYAFRRGIHTEWLQNSKRIDNLDNALRIFEIHKNQVGCLIFIADTLASIFIVSHPQDYRLLHHSLILDFYSDIIWQYSSLPYECKETPFAIDEKTVHNLEDLYKALERAQQEQQQYYQSMVRGLISRKLNYYQRYHLSPFTLYSFVTDALEENENHIGEAILHQDTIEYMQTYRLSGYQSKRVRILQTLVENDWNLEKAGAVLKKSKDNFILYMQQYGFDYLIDKKFL